MSKREKIQNVIEAALFAAEQPLSVDVIQTLFLDDWQPSRSEVAAALSQLQTDYVDRGVELVQVATGYRFQVRPQYSDWVARLWEKKPGRYSRAMMETLSIIAYRQPITRAEIEEIRGVGLSSSIIKTLQEREWVRTVGHRDLPGRPTLYATTRQFLDYLGLKNLDELPPLDEIRDIGSVTPEFDFEMQETPQPLAEQPVSSVDIDRLDD